MKVKDFINFIWQEDENGHCICDIGDIYITVMRKKSYDSEDIVMQNVLISTSNLDFFNNCDVMSIRIYSGQGAHREGYTTLKIVICEAEEKTNNEDN